MWLARCNAAVLELEKQRDRGYYVIVQTNEPICVTGTEDSSQKMQSSNGL